MKGVNQIRGVTVLIILFFILIFNSAYSQKRFLIDNIKPSKNSKRKYSYKFSSAEMYFILNKDTIKLSKINDNEFVISNSDFLKFTTSKFELQVVTDYRTFIVNIDENDFLYNNSFELFFRINRGTKDVLIFFEDLGVTNIYYFDEIRRRNCIKHIFF